jgi:hypothetical protein
MTENLKSVISGSIASVGPEYPVMSDVACKFLVLESGTPFVQVSRGAMAIAPPTVGATQVASCVRRKVQRAQSWASRPLWLIVWLTAMYAWNEGTLDDLQRAYRPPDTGNPFNRIIVGDGRSVVIYDIS